MHLFTSPCYLCIYITYGMVQIYGTNIHQYVCTRCKRKPDGFPMDLFCHEKVLLCLKWLQKNPKAHREWNSLFTCLNVECPFYIKNLMEH